MNGRVHRQRQPALQEQRPGASIIVWFVQGRMKIKLSLLALLGALSLAQPPLCLAGIANGKQLYQQRCAVCHGADIRAAARWPTRATHRPRPDDGCLPAAARGLPGVIVSSVILRPNGNLIPRTLQENGVKIPPHAWSVQDFRDLNQYMSGVILQRR